MSSGLKGYSKPWGDGTPKWARDATLNDSDKLFTVPPGKCWVVTSVRMHILTSATVGNRVVNIIYNYDSTNVGWQVYFPNIPASTNVHYAGVAGIGGMTATFNLGLLALPWVVLPAGATVRVYDSAVIDAAADDLTVVLHYVEYDA